MVTLVSEAAEQFEPPNVKVIRHDGPGAGGRTLDRLWDAQLHGASRTTPQTPFTLSEIAPASWPRLLAS
jgi:hypothetical protein